MSRMPFGRRIGRIKTLDQRLYPAYPAPEGHPAHPVPSSYLVLAFTFLSC